MLRVDSTTPPFTARAITCTWSHRQRRPGCDRLRVGRFSCLHSRSDRRGRRAGLRGAATCLHLQPGRGHRLRFAPGHEGELFRVAVGVRPNGLSFDARRGLLLAANVGKPDLAGSFTLSVVDINRREMTADRWVKAVNADGRFGTWRYGMARKPADVADILSAAANSSTGPA